MWKNCKGNGKIFSIVVNAIGYNSDFCSDPAGISRCVRSGRIVDVYWPSGQIASGGYSGSPEIIIENTGSEAHTFYVQVATQDPMGEWDELGMRFLPTDIIEPGKKFEFSSVIITIDPFYDNMPRGYYNARVTLYADFFKDNQLDSKNQYNAFEV